MLRMTACAGQVKPCPWWQQQVACPVSSYADPQNPANARNSSGHWTTDRDCALILSDLVTWTLETGGRQRF